MKSIICPGPGISGKITSKTARVQFTIIIEKKAVFTFFSFFFTPGHWSKKMSASIMVIPNIPTNFISGHLVRVFQLLDRFLQFLPSFQRKWLYLGKSHSTGLSFVSMFVDISSQIHPQNRKYQHLTLS